MLPPALASRSEARVRIFLPCPPSRAVWVHAPRASSALFSQAVLLLCVAAPHGLYQKEDQASPARPQNPLQMRCQHAALQVSAELVLQVAHARQVAGLVRLAAGDIDSPRLRAVEEVERAPWEAAAIPSSRVSQSVDWMFRMLRMAQVVSAPSVEGTAAQHPRG